MAVREVASAEFYELSRRTEGKLLVVQFTATWCGPCRRVAPQFEALARRNADVDFVKVYEHTSRDVIINSGVRSFPTFRFYCNGNMVDECRGANIQGVEQVMLRHKASARVDGPVKTKIRFDCEKPRASGEGSILVTQEAELEVHASEGLEIFKFQVLSISDIEANDQVLTAGDSNTPIDSDAGLAAALKGTGGGVYGNYPVVRVTKRTTLQQSQRAQAGPAAAAVSARNTSSIAPVWEECCSRTYFGTRPVLQPAYVLREEQLLPRRDLSKLQQKRAGPEAIILVCRQCAENCFIAGRAECCPAVSASKPFVCQSKEACDKGYGTDLFSRRADSGAEVYEPGSPASTSVEADAAAAAERVYYDARGAAAGGAETEDMVNMRQKVASGMAGALAYEDSALQAKARNALPPEAGEGSGIAESAAEIAAAGGCSREEAQARALMRRVKCDLAKALLGAASERLALEAFSLTKIPYFLHVSRYFRYFALEDCTDKRWFKKVFFKWVNKPPCSRCGARGPSMEGQGVVQPTPEEAASKVFRVERYLCKDCGAETRFPRYDDPGKLLETRAGRCGEWANCFTLLCRAIGLEARRVMDWTDHVWTEVWIPARSEWVHADPCENKLDKPLMYEQGWNKRLSYVLAFDRDGGVDVTRRYTRRWVEVLSRRNLVPEKWLKGVLMSSGAARPAARTALTASRLADEQRELEVYESLGCEDRDLDGEEKEGRQSGDAEWIASRGEDGDPVAGADRGKDAAAATETSHHSLVGAPLGVLLQQQAGRGLSLCVAAVVEADGDVSILASSTTLCRLSGKGGAMLCAAAISATDGVLLAVRTFVLRDVPGSTALTADIAGWLAGLPEGVVIVCAAGGRVGGGEASLDAAVTTALGSLLPNEHTALDTSEPTGWTLLGWKGPGQHLWARHQSRAPTGSSSRRRAAVYAEWSLPLPCSSPSPEQRMPRTTPETARVELKDTLSRRCLRSLPNCADAAGAVAGAAEAAAPAADNAAFPARGQCSRRGEPAVAVGPDLDLVHCPGWTTVLPTPGGVHVQGADAGAERFALCPWRVTRVCSAVGGWHDDTIRFDDAAIGCPALVMGGSPIALPDGVPFLPVARVREIIVWSGNYVNGVQVVYDVNGDAIRGPMHLGDNGLYRQSRLVLDAEGGEVVVEITVKAGSLVDNLYIRTSKGRVKSWGGDGGEEQHTWTVPAGSSFLGFHGGMGGYLHCLGVTISQEDGTPTGINCSHEEIEEQQQQHQKTLPAVATSAVPSALSALVKTGLYNANSVFRACAQLVAFNPPPPSERSEATSAVTPAQLSEDVLAALETAQKYADNLLAQPLDERVCRIRLANKFFDRKIGRLAGGGGVIRALGFELADEDGRMQYVFRRRSSAGGGGGLDGLRHARGALTEFLTLAKDLR